MFLTVNLAEWEKFVFDVKTTILDFGRGEIWRIFGDVSIAITGSYEF